jgi:hypothetical protein
LFALIIGINLYICRKVICFQGLNKLHPLEIEDCSCHQQSDTHGALWNEAEMTEEPGIHDTQLSNEAPQSPQN